MEKPKISIVIPVYNGGKYLYSCLNSVINQTLKELEIFLIDDGSTDRSLEICKQFEKKDSRIAVIHTENKGECFATNLGREKCIGKYFYTMDDDDIILPDALESLYIAAEKDNCEVTRGIAISSKENNYEPLLYWPKKWFKEQIINWHDLNNKELNQFFGGQPEVWSGIYNLDWLNKNNIYHNDSNFSDGNFIFKVKAKSTNYKFIPKFIYLWTIHTSLSHTSNKPFAVVSTMKDLEDYLLNENINLKEQILNEKKRVYIWNYFRIDKKYREEFLSMIEEDIKKIILNMEKDNEENRIYREKQSLYRK